MPRSEYMDKAIIKEVTSLTFQMKAIQWAFFSTCLFPEVIKTDNAILQIKLTAQAYIL